MAVPADALPEVAPAPRDPAVRRLGWVGLGIFMFSFLVALLAASSLGLAWATVRGLDPGEASRDLGVAVLSSVGLWVGFLGLPLLWSRWAGGAGPLLGLRARWIDLPVGLAAGLASVIVTTVVSAVALSDDELKALESKAEESVGRASGLAATVLLVLVLCVATPIAEEVFFRGLLFRSLHRAAGLVVAVVVGGVVFGLVHYDASPIPGTVVAVQLGLLSLFGVVLCVLVHATGRLGASVVAHAAFNSATVVTILVQR